MRAGYPTSTQRIPNAKAESVERHERLNLLRDKWKTSIWTDGDNVDYELPNPDVLLAYSPEHLRALNYAQERQESWEEEMPAATASRMKKQELGKSNLHAKGDFGQKVESLDLDPRMKRLLATHEEVFGALPTPLSCKKLVQMDLKLKPEFKGARVRRRPYPAPQAQIDEIEHQI